jgi:hypothetical protein
MRGPVQKKEKTSRINQARKRRTREIKKAEKKKGSN